MVVASGNMQATSMEWIIDSGASNHICSMHEVFTTYHPTNQTVRIGDDSKLAAAGYGTVSLPVYVSGCKDSLLLRNILHVPDIAMNLVSASCLSEYGTVSIAGNICQLKSLSGQVLLEASRQRHLYHVNQSPTSRTMVLAIKLQPDPKPIDITLTHCCLGHLNVKAVHHLA